MASRTHSSGERPQPARKKNQKQNGKRRKLRNIVETKLKPKPGDCESCGNPLQHRLDTREGIVYRYCKTPTCGMQGIGIPDAAIGADSEEVEDESEVEVLRAFDSAEQETEEDHKDLSDETERLFRSPTNPGLHDKGLGSGEKQTRAIQSRILNSNQNFNVNTDEGAKKMQREKSVLRRLVTPERHYNDGYALSLGSQYCRALGLSDEQFAYLGDRLRAGLTVMPKSSKSQLRDFVSLVVQAFGYPPLEQVLRKRKSRKVS